MTNIRKISHNQYGSRYDKSQGMMRQFRVIPPGERSPVEYLRLQRLHAQQQYQTETE